MFRCNHCGAIFEEPEERLDRNTDGETCWTESTSVCPMCGDEDIEKVSECFMCGKAIDYGDKVCHECEAEFLHDVSEALRPVLNTKEKIELFDDLFDGNSIQDRLELDGFPKQNSLREFMTSVYLNYTNTDKEKPEKSGYYMCVTRSHLAYIIPYSKKYDLFNALDSDDEEEAKRHSVEVVNWAEVPERFKEAYNETAL